MSGFNAETQSRRGWEVKPLRAFLSPVSVRNRPDAQLLSVTREAGVIVRNTESKEENHNYIPDDLSNYKFVEKGQFVINKMKAWQGSYGVSPYDGIVSPAYFVYDLDFPCKEFFSLAIRSKAYVQYFQRFSKGIRVDQWDLMPEALKLIPFAFPPLPEQKEIVAYLDAETGRIDKAIAAEEKMIALLQERREIVINEAVGGGRGKTLTNPAASLPDGWEMKRFKSLFSTCTGISFTKAELVEEGCPVLSYGQIHSKDNPGVGVNGKLIRRIPATLASEKALAYIGDFLFADTSEDLEGCGNCICIDTDEPIYAGSHVILARKQHEEIGRFLAYEFASVSWRKQLRKLVNGVKVYSITQTILNSVPVWLPPLPEQEEIVKRLDAETGKIDRAIEVKRRQIELLRERRQIVIDEAVTGRVPCA